MKNLSLLILVLLACVSARAASFIVTATVTITNTPVVTNTFVYNSDTRTWQTNSSSTRIQATNSIAQSVTNLYQHFVTYPLVGPVSVRITTSSNLTFVSPSGTNVSITFGGSGWGRVSYVTNAVATGFTVTVPDANITNRPTATNIASGIIDWLKYASNTMSATAPAFTNFLTIAPNGRTFTNVIFSTPAITGGGLTNTAVTNAPSISGSNIAFVTGTLTNVTERMSTNVNPVITAARGISGTNTGIIGGSMTNVTATNFTVLGGQSFGVTNMDQIWLDDDLSGNLSIATLRALYYTNFFRIDNFGWPIILNDGGGTQGYSFTNGLGFGEHVLTVGYATQLFPALAPVTGNYPFDSILTNIWTIPNRWTSTNIWFFGGFTSTNATNFGSVSSGTTLAGNSTNSSSWTETSSTVSTLANGHNNVVISDQTSFAKLSGPSAAFYLDGLANGWTDRVVTLKNDSGQNMTVTPESGLVDSANRFATASGNDYLVETNSTVVVKYLSSRWWVIGGSALLSTNVLNTRTNTLVLTNGVIAGSLTNGFTLDFSTGLTGSVSAAGITLGVSSSSGGTNFIATTNGMARGLTNLSTFYSDRAVLTNLIVGTNSAVVQITNGTVITTGSIRSTGGTISTAAGNGIGPGNGSIFTFFNQGSSGNYDEAAFYRSDTTLLGMMTYGYGTGLGTPAIHFTNANIYLGSAARNFNTATNPVNVPYLSARLGVMLPAATPFTAPASLNLQGAHLWSDGTNLCVVLQNSAGTRTTNKVTMTAWP